ncbi:hypothetical protein [Chryseobacterium sp. JUb7]|uniref:hypothetical protein n=1 Tax=Chryseobacterium sp. JUb7 TaxID=2940599 RepID=UPI00216792F5|nr:hypothetical protein [Chryseobacterium sp. JUb7]MCS3531631.1 hypothetical protein [Chryseobacterium sp. JUb7]
MKNKFLLIFSCVVFGISSAQVGVGNPNPAVNLDARSATGNSAIAFGNTNQTAMAAGAGAMKYDNTTKQMFYSDGTNWVSMAANQTTTSFIPKVVASGRANAGMGTTAGGAFNKWTFGQIFTNDGNWNTTTNTYTVPVGGDGFYQFNLAGGIVSSSGANQSNWTISINSGAQFWTLNSVNNFGAGFTSYRGGSVAIFLNAGSTINFGSNHCAGCNSPAETYSVAVGATFTITSLGSNL